MFFALKKGKKNLFRGKILGVIGRNIFKKRDYRQDPTSRTLSVLSLQRKWRIKARSD